MNVWRNALKNNDISLVKEMIEKKDKLCNFWLAIDWAKSKEMVEIIIQHIKGLGMLTPCSRGYNMKPIVCKGEKKYAVVEWFNYRKEHSAGCRAIFEKYEDALDHAYKYAVNEIFSDLYGNYRKVNEETFIKLQEIINKKKYTTELSDDEKKFIEDCHEKGLNFYIISEEDITDNNGAYSPYNKVLASYINSRDGYCSTVYCVVEYFPGVENRWNFDEEEVILNDESTWYPEYS